MKIVVVTATYNEKENIGNFITLVEEKVFPIIKHHDMYILVADDNSPDGTADIVRGLMPKYPNLDINSGPRKGLGAAYVRAMSYAIEHIGADIVMSIDADLQHDPRRIPTFLKKIEQGYDIVSGTRYSDGGSMPKDWPLHRKVCSVAGNFIVRAVTGRFHLHDWTSGFRAIKKEVFLKEREKVCPFQGYTFLVAFLYKSILDGYIAGEVPIDFINRKLGNSKIAPLAYIINLLKYVISERIRELGKVMLTSGKRFSRLAKSIALLLNISPRHLNRILSYNCYMIISLDEEARFSALSHLDEEIVRLSQRSDGDTSCHHKEDDQPQAHRPDTSTTGTRGVATTGRA